MLPPLKIKPGRPKFPASDLYRAHTLRSVSVIIIRGWSPCGPPI